MSNAPSRRHKPISAGVQVTIKTPVLDKMLANKAESQAVGNFLNWLQENSMFIAGYGKERGDRDMIFPDGLSIEELLAAYFDVDLAEAERERCKILAAIR
jgi:hypothetical protein